LHTGHAFVRGNAALALRPEDFTMAECLKGGGYHTGLIGKWGLGNEGTTGVPQRKGFEEFVGYLDQAHAHDYYTDHLWRYDGRSGHDQPISLVENSEGRKQIYTHNLFTTAALNFVRLNKPDARNGSQPFFLYLAYTIPHANNEEGARSGNGMQVPSDAPYTKEAWPQVEKNKAAMISLLDRDVGALVAKLKQLGMDDHTVLLFTSDNGPHREGGVNPAFFQSSGPLRGIKRDLYEGGIRVPMIVRWPGEIKPGRVSDQAWAFWDLLPTLAEIARAATPAKLDGISMLPTLLGRAQTNQHDFLYWEFHERGFQQAARAGSWKAIRPRLDKPLELYNLETDLGEQRNVADENQGIVAKFETYFKQARTDSDHFPIRPTVLGGAATNPPAARSQ